MSKHNDIIYEQIKHQNKTLGEQDLILEDISLEVNNLEHISIHIGNELDEHNQLLDNMNNDIDNTNIRLNNANKKIDIITRISENKYTLTIVFLIIILIIMIVIYFSK